MTTPFDPSDDDTWNGGYYEAAMVIGPSTSEDADEKLRDAIAALWGCQAVAMTALGDRAAWDWNARAPRLSDLPVDQLNRLYGTLECPTVGTLPFTSVVVREPDGHDWLSACVPVGGIPQSAGFPFGDDEECRASRSWREPLETSLADVALNIARTIDIQIAAIGFEISGIINVEPSRLTQSGMRRVGYLIKENGALRYWPTNEWGPHT